MILHSVMPAQAVLGLACWDEGQPQTPAQRPLAWGCLEGRLSPGGFVVERICSTDPAAYLDPALSPGQVLR